MKKYYRKHRTGSNIWRFLKALAISMLACWALGPIGLFAVVLYFMI